MESNIRIDDIVCVVIKGQPLIGRVNACKGTKIILSFGGQRRNQELPKRDIIVVESIGNELRTEALPTPEEIQAINISKKDTAELWWLLVSDCRINNQSNVLMNIVELTELLFGKTNLKNLAALWNWLHGPQYWFRIRRDKRIQPRFPLEIRRQYIEDKQARIKEKSIQQQLDILKSNEPLTKEKLELLDPNWQESIRQMIILAGEDESELHSDASVQNIMRTLSINFDRRSLRTWLIQRNLIDPHQPLALRGSVWSKNFTELVINESNNLISIAGSLLEGDETRLDLTEHNVYTLDDSNTKEIDDALSLERDDEGDWIWIHIADPARLIKDHSLIELEARRRATSLYLVDGILPMLPLDLAYTALSLRARHRCAALSVAVRLDINGAISESRILRSWITPKYGLTYEDGNELIELAPSGDEDLADLYSLLKRRLHWRINQGAIIFEQPEGRFRLHENNLNFQIIEPSPARLMVSEGMLLMGAVVAEFGIQNNLALPYRSQTTSELPKESKLLIIPEGPARDSEIKRCLNRGVQGINPLPHFSLGLSAYVQATSPIRRYADLVTHYQVIAVLNNQEPMSRNQLEERISDISFPISQAIQISREDQRHWLQVWLEANPNKSRKAIFLRWLKPNNRLALIHLPELAMDLVGYSEGITPELGQLTSMTIIHIDSSQDELHFCLN